MSVIISAYDTTVCSGFPITKIKEEIIKAKLMGGLHELDVSLERYGEQFKLYLVEGGNTFADTIPYFKQPMLIPDENNSGSGFFVIDVRAFGHWSAPHQKFAVRNGVEYAWHLKRAILNQIWLDGRVEALRDISNLPISAYSALISQSIARRFSLDPAEQMVVAVLAAYFYMCHFTEETSFTEHEFPLIVGKIARVTNVPASNVEKMLNGIACIHTLEDFCSEVHKRVGNVALQDFNIGTMVMICSGTWFGDNSREIMAVGLEHIPTWLMMVEASLSSATYRRSVFAKIVQKIDKGNMGTLYTRSIAEIIGGSSGITDGASALVDYATFF